MGRRLDRLQELADRYPGVVLPFPHNVTQYEQVPSLFINITSLLGGLDLIVYAAGVMPEIGVSEFNFEKDRHIVEVNVLGAIAWLNQAATRFDGAGHGTIIGIGSVAGDRGRVGQPVYNMSKSALATYLESLRNRLSRRGVNVLTVKPGPLQTEMTAHLGLRGAMPPEEAARRILASAHRNGELYLKPSHRLAFAIIKAIPSPIFRRLKI